jgi:hypothetical protein
MNQVIKIKVMAVFLRAARSLIAARYNTRIPHASMVRVSRTAVCQLYSAAITSGHLGHLRMILDALGNVNGISRRCLRIARHNVLPVNPGQTLCTPGTCEISCISAPLIRAEEEFLHSFRDAKCARKEMVRRCKSVRIEIQRFSSRTKYLVGMPAHVPVGKPRLDIEHVRKPQARPQVSLSRNAGVCVRVMTYFTKKYVFRSALIDHLWR